MISDVELTLWEDITNRALADLNAHGSTHHHVVTQGAVLLLIAEVRRLREQMTPDCVNGCIFKQARKIVEEGKK